MYDLYMTPTSILGFSGKTNAIDKLNKEYEQIAQQVEKINYKYNFDQNHTYLEYQSYSLILLVFL